MDKGLVIDYLSLVGILDQVNIHDFIDTVLLRDKKHIDSLAALVGIKLHPWAVAFEYRGWTFKLGEKAAATVNRAREKVQEKLVQDVTVYGPASYFGKYTNIIKQGVPNEEDTSGN